MMSGARNRKIITFILLAVLICPCLTFAAGLTQFEKETLSYINRYRAEHGLAPLIYDEQLQALAKEHSEYMHKTRTLGHQNFKSRYNKSGRQACAENAGVYSPTPYNQFKGWRDSPGHRRNLLDRVVRYAGVSKVGAYVTFFACN
jgi:uncharacterized protein YkwD